MTSRELWDRYRAWLIDLPELGVRLDVSRMGLPADYLKSMEGPMLGAFDAMDALEAGAIANPDEDRMVGHYWLRAPDLAPSEDIRNAILETGARVRRFAAVLAVYFLIVYFKTIRPFKICHAIFLSNFGVRLLSKYFILTF